MANITVKSLLNASKSPAIIGCGVTAGLALNKIIASRVVGSEAMKGLLGETTSTMKKYLAPFITTIIGAGIYLTSSDKMVKDLATGVAVAGPATVAVDLFMGKSLLSGLNGGLVGDYLPYDEELDGLGADESDSDEIEGIDEDLEGLGDDEEETISGDTQVAIAGDELIAGDEIAIAGDELIAGDDDEIVITGVGYIK